MKVKYFLAALLIFAMLLSGCASVAPTEGTTEPPVTDAPATEAPTTEAPTTEAPTEPVVTEPITRENVVTDAYRDVYMVTDGVEYVHAYPQINLPGEYAKEINEKVRGAYEGGINSDGVLPWQCDYSYEYYVYEDILSLVFRSASGDVIEDRTGFDIGDYYYVYTLHISDGTPVTQEELLKLAGVTEEEFYQRVTVAAGDAACTFFLDTTIEECLAADDPSATLPVESFRASIAEEAVHRAVPYLDDEGKLWFAAEITHIAAAGTHMVLRPYDQTEPLSPYYDRIRTLAEEATAKE